LFFYSNIYFFYLPFRFSVCFFTQSGFIAFYFLLTPFIFVNINKKLLKTTRLFFFLFLKKLSFSFSGKGYKLLKNLKGTVTFNFGHSHLFYIYNHTSEWFLITKTRGFVFGLNGFLLNQTLQCLINTKPINLYTGRGVRLLKQIVIKKPGKISTYL